MTSASAPTSDLIHDIYAAAMSPEIWPEVLQQLAECLGAKGAIVFERRQASCLGAVGATHVSAEFDPAIVDAYLNRFGEWERRDQLLFERSSLENDRIELVGDDQLEGPEGPIMKQPNARFLKFVGLRNRAAALLDKDVLDRGRFSVQFDAGRGPITPEEAGRSRELLPHLAKSLSIAQRFREVTHRNAIAVEALDRLRVGVAVVDGAGGVVFENTEFKRLVDEDNPLYRNPQDRIAIRSTDCQKYLQGLLDDVSQHGKYGARPRKEAVIVADTPDKSGLCLEVMPMERMATIGTKALGGFVVTCLDTHRFLDMDVPRLARHFGLSSAETTILARLSEGLSNLQIAEQVDRSVETVNSHVKKLLNKMGCENRSQLIRMAIGFGHQSFLSD